MNVYDFDNTIYRGESAVDLFWYYLKQDKSLLRYVPEVAAALVRYKRGKITIEEALSRLWRARGRLLFDDPGF